MIEAQEKFDYQSYLELPEEQALSKPKSDRYSKKNVRQGQLILMATVFSLLLTGIAIAFYFAQVAALGFKIQQLQNELNQLQADNDSMTASLNQMMSLQRIETIATTQLGMVKPDAQKVLLIAADTGQSGTAQDSKNNSSGAAPKNQPASQEGAKTSNQKAETPNKVIQAFTNLVNHWEQKL